MTTVSSRKMYKGRKEKESQRLKPTKHVQQTQVKTEYGSEITLTMHLCIIRYYT